MPEERCSSMGMLVINFFCLCLSLILFSPILPISVYFKACFKWIECSMIAVFFIFFIFSTLIFWLLFSYYFDYCLLETNVSFLWLLLTFLFLWLLEIWCDFTCFFLFFSFSVCFSVCYFCVWNLWLDPVSLHTLFRPISSFLYPGF